jgi:hypothetical protein
MKQIKKNCYELGLRLAFGKQVTQPIAHIWFRGILVVLVLVHYTSRTRSLLFYTFFSGFQQQLSHSCSPAAAQDFSSRRFHQPQYIASKSVTHFFLFYFILIRRPWQFAGPWQRSTESRCCRWVVAQYHLHIKGCIIKWFKISSHGASL